MGEHLVGIESYLFVCICTMTAYGNMGGIIIVGCLRNGKDRENILNHTVVQAIYKAIYKFK